MVCCSTPPLQRTCGRTQAINPIAYIQNAPNLKKEQYGKISKLMMKIQDILKNGPYYGIHLIVYAYNYKGLVDVMDNDSISSFGNHVILQGGEGGASQPDEKEELGSLNKGMALLVTEDYTTTYDRDPVMIYNECHSDTLQQDDVLDYIFSIYKQKQD